MLSRVVHSHIDVLWEGESVGTQGAEPQGHVCPRRS